MAYTKTTWQDRQVTNPMRFTMTLISGTAGTTGSVYDFTPNEGTIVQSGTPLSASNMNHIEQGVADLDTGKVSKSGDTMTGDLTITKTSPSTIYDDTDALGTRMAITAYQSKLSFRWGANSTTNEMMYLDGVTGLTFKPNLAYTGASTIGQSGIHMKNSDIVGVNGLYLSDEAQAEGEGINFPKTGVSGSSTTQSDYTCMRVDGTGRLYLGNNPFLQSGSVNITPVANTPTKVTVTFPKAFTSAPHVVATPESAVPGTQVTGCSVANITATTVDIYITRTNTNATTVHWMATGQ